jgi:hypothetical protein
MRYRLDLFGAVAPGDTGPGTGRRRGMTIGSWQAGFGALRAPCELVAPHWVGWNAL